MTSKGTYTAIQDWMLDLGLDIYETLAYAVIFGFSQDGESTFTGSLSYLGRKIMCSRSKVIRVLKSLTEKGLVQKIELTKNGVKFCEYRACLPDTGGVSQDTGSVSQTPGGSVSQTPNNIVYKNKEEKKDSNNNTFDFRSELIRIGVSEETADAWLEIRRKKKASNSKIAFKEITTEMGKVEGMTPEECIRKAVARNWCGFEAAWVQMSPRYQQPKKESVYEHNARVYREMFGEGGSFNFNLNPDEQ